MKRPVKSKIREWLLRYGPAEAVSLILTVLPALWTLQHTGNRTTTAWVATWAGNIGYFGTILAVDIIASRKQHLSLGERYSWRSLGSNLRALIIEFGVAELLDSFLIRPALMYYLPLWIGSDWGGLVIAKLLADVSFYLPAIIFYEWAKRRGLRA